MKYEEVKDKIYMRQGELIGLQGENYLVAVSENLVYELPPAAYYVWLMMDGERTLEETIERSSEELQIGKEVLVDPFLVILEKLIEVNLVAEKRVT